jgi:hypothetical protein
VTKEELFVTIERCHQNVGHAGRDKTWSEVRANYAGIKHVMVDLFLKTCSTCAQRQVVKNPPSGKPMVNLSFLLRVQIDLIDFRSRPDQEFNWVLHARDCFTKFSWAYAMKTKSAAEVASHLFDQFCTFGAPRILQSDNGRENGLILLLYFIKLLYFTTFSFFLSPNAIILCENGLLFFIFYELTLFYYIFLLSIAKCVFLSQCKHQNTQFPFLLNSHLY